MPILVSSIAFPKLRDASCPLCSAPTPVDEEQLRVLGLSGEGTVQHAAAKPTVRTPEVDADALARLARLRAGDAQGLGEGLQDMVRFASRLENMAAGDAPPARRPVNVLRQDEIRAGLTRGQVLAGAPQSGEGCFIVPQGALGEGAQA